MKKINFLHLFCCLAIFYSCSKQSEFIDAESALNSQSDEVSVNSLGMLNFKGHEEFHKFLGYLDRIQVIEDIDKELSQYDFMSYVADTLDDNKQLGDFDPILSRVLNKYGAAQIADSICVFTKTYEHWIHKDDVELYNKVAKGSELMSSNVRNVKVEYLPVEGISLDGLVSEGNQSISNDKVKGSIDRKSYNWWGPGTQHDLGILTFYTPETPVIRSSDRPQRIKIVIENRLVDGFNRFTFSLYGEIYRRGGLFARQAWRSYTMSNVRFDFLKLIRTDIRIPDQPPVYGREHNNTTTVLVMTSDTRQMIPRFSWIAEMELRFHAIQNHGSNRQNTMYVHMIPRIPQVSGLYNRLYLERNW